MTENGFACLQRAVTLARDHQISSVKNLVSRLQREKWEKDEIDEALKVWSEYEQKKNPKQGPSRYAA